MNQDGYYDNIDLHIRWSDRQDLVLNVEPDELISSIKEKIHHSAGHTNRKYIRLIHNGKVLQDEQTLKSYGIGKITVVNSKAKLEPPSPVYIHCSLSDYIPQSPIASYNSQPQIIPPTGFDRLRESGFTEEDIQNIRAQFHRLHGTAFDETDETSEEARNLEEQWMDNTGETLPDGTVQGTYKEMMWGLIFGFFLGIICLFWFRESVFSRRQQMGIIAGMLINISFGVLHASVLSYGKLNLHNTKKPKTSWAHYLSTLTVPKHYFNHFYVVGLSFGILCSLELYFKGGILFYALRQLDQPSQSDRLSQMQCRIGLLLINVHLARRVYESFRIERPSKEATMHISHYLIGIGFYGAMVFGTWLEGASYLGVWPTTPIEKGFNHHKCSNIQVLT
ncbi:hypothetical protein G6F46_001202 [Rhizopus delemar]|uniref:Ubiquitin-like domain-containing protein n=2 Tax=Rhizopus TaxID=4842 RepID=A0A9P6ZDJ8_9FUNG|nr:hypothetical protein G6F55_003770 [Rhizopus delemar]KAG1552327.1 hypothetical protein G6F51_001298 [Rhizopus arrhizus]KAG1505511.1 hypothetical protein G6F54_000266 [Rhizopus delemar]KAG1518999.1 hypothetical protein G6F53_000131 [Rhizopus delemar]KAG1528702.1 hypothetical protein G6F52_000406 [Rhizopus delemar]